MKTRSLTTLITLLLATFVASGQSEKTLVKAFNLQGSRTVFLDLDGPVEVQEWNQEQMRILMTITLENGTEVMLKSLVQAGRYNLQSEVKGDEIKIFAPALEKEVMLRNGQNIQEKVSYQVFAPSNVQVKNKNDDNLSSSSF